MTAESDDITYCIESVLATDGHFLNLNIDNVSWTVKISASEWADNGIEHAPTTTEMPFSADFSQNNCESYNAEDYSAFLQFTRKI